MKRLFSITKGTAVTAALAIAASVVLSLGGTYAVGQIARNNAIGSDAAVNFALIDAGILPEDAMVIKNKFDYESGEFVYEVCFIADGTTYDYLVKASDGSIVSAEYETADGYRAVVGNTGNNRATALSSSSDTGTSTADATNTDPAKTKTGQQGMIGVDEAKRIALQRAGLTEQDKVVFTTAKLDNDDGMMLYDIEFYLGDKEYEVDIDATNGKILTYSSEIKDVVPQPAQQPQVTQPVQQQPQVTQPVQQPQVTQPVQQPQVTQPVQQPQVTQPVQQQPQVTQPAQPAAPQPDYDDDDNDYDDDDDDDDDNDYDDHHDDHDDDDDD